MINKDRHWSVGSIPYVIKEDREHFEKMYPQTTMNGRYILWLEFGFYWNYYYKSITPKIIVELNNGKHLEMPKLITRHLMPNKNWSYVCMKNGRKSSDKGVILYFNTFEEISQIKRICCCWDIEYEEDKHYRAFVNYNLKFKYEFGKFNYSLTSNDTELDLIARAMEGERSIFDNKMEEYNKIFYVRQTEEFDGEELTVIKGDVNEADALECMTSVFGVEGLVKALENDTAYSIESFSAEEEIEPLECSSN